MEDIRQSLTEIHTDVRGIGLGVRNIGEDVGDMRTWMYHYFPTPETAPKPTERRPSDTAPNTETSNPDSLDHRFLDQVREDKRQLDIKLGDIPLLELTKSAVWWLGKVRLHHSEMSQPYLTPEYY